MRDLVLGALVLEGEFPAVRLSVHWSARQAGTQVSKDIGTYRLGSMLLPWALRFSFFMATGPRFARWSALGAVMMLSQMTAWLVAFWPEPEPPADGHSAVT